MENPEIVKALGQMQVIQLDMWSQQRITLANGQTVTAQQWAEELGLFYTPSLLFFDPRGEEIIRVDSIVWFNRLHNVLRYINSGAYRQYPNFQQWRQSLPK
jgi:thioredoxin-related protein